MSGRVRRLLASAAIGVAIAPAAIAIASTPAAAAPAVERLVGVAIIDEVTYLVYEVPGGYRFVPA